VTAERDREPARSEARRCGDQNSPSKLPVNMDYRSGTGPPQGERLRKTARGSAFLLGRVVLRQSLDVGKVLLPAEGTLVLDELEPAEKRQLESVDLDLLSFRPGTEIARSCHPGGRVAASIDTPWT